MLTEGVLFVAPISIVRGGRTSDPPPPNIAISYREQVTHLHTALQEDTEEKRLKAGEVLRSLMQRTVLTPEKGELKIELIGDWPTS